MKSRIEKDFEKIVDERQASIEKVRKMSQKIYKITKTNIDIDRYIQSLKIYDKHE